MLYNFSYNSWHTHIDGIQPITKEYIVNQPESVTISVKLSLNIEPIADSIIKNSIWVAIKVKKSAKDFMV